MHPLLLCSLSLLFCLSNLSFSAGLRGFSLDLNHHDSQLSPFDDKSRLTSLELNITATRYSYLIGLNVTTEGHSTVSTHANLDTGSDLIWLNGKGCEGDACFCDETECVQKPSSTPEIAGMGVCEWCEKLPEQAKSGPCSEDTCRYKLKYGDKFTTEGVLTNGNFSLTTSGGDHHGSNNSIWFGVSDHSTGPLSKKSAGIVGLGRGKLSLISQLHMPFKFSYCLPDPNFKSVSKLLLGSQVTISDNNTPLLSDEKVCDNRYCVRLAYIFLNGDPSKNINVEQENGVMFIDSGSTFTFLNKKLFHMFIKKVEEITGEKNKKLNDTFRHCFTPEKGENLDKVSFQFDKGEKLNLKEVNFFDKIEHENVDYLCLTVVEGGEQNFLGNRAQIDFKVAIGYEEENKGKVSFDELENCGTEQHVQE